MDELGLTDQILFDRWLERELRRTLSCEGGSLPGLGRPRYQAAFLRTGVSAVAYPSAIAAALAGKVVVAFAAALVAGTCAVGFATSGSANPLVWGRHAIAGAGALAPGHGVGPPRSHSREGGSGPWIAPASAAGRGAGTPSGSGSPHGTGFAEGAPHPAHPAHPAVGPPGLSRASGNAPRGNGWGAGGAQAKNPPPAGGAAKNRSPAHGAVNKPHGILPGRR